LDLEGTYEDVDEMLAASGNVNPVGRAAVERLELNDVSQEYIREVLGLRSRDTGQSVEELSDLAFTIVLDREDQGSQLSGVWQPNYCSERIWRPE